MKTLPQESGISMLEAALALSVILPLFYLGLCLVLYLAVVRDVRNFVQRSTTMLSMVPFRANSGDQMFFIQPRNTEWVEEDNPSRDAMLFKKECDDYAHTLVAAFQNESFCNAAPCGTDQFRLSVVGAFLAIKRDTGGVRPESLLQTSYGKSAVMGALSSEDGPSIQERVKTIVDTNALSQEPFLYAIPSSLNGIPEGQFYGNWDSRIFGSVDSVTAAQEEKGAGNYLRVTYFVGVQLSVSLKDTWYGKTLDTVFGERIPLTLTEYSLGMPRALL